ncbi:MAG: hypothetical protein ABR602_06935, partial [Gemmatimonadales bacterium]
MPGTHSAAFIHRGPRERGSALLLVLIVVVITTLSAALAHRAALDTLRHARTTLAVLRATEAAGAGLASALAGGPLLGTLPGGASWLVTEELPVGGDRILRSVGASATPYLASSEALALVDSAGVV